MAESSTELFVLLNSNKLDDLEQKLTSDTVNAEGSIGQSLLHDAVDKANVEAVRMLLNRGANPDAVDRRGDTPLIYAASRHNHDTAKLCDISNLLLAAGANPNIKGGKGMTAIRWAVGNPSGDLRMIRVLLKHNADPWIKNDAGGDAVSAAVVIFPELAVEFREKQKGQA